MIVKSLKKLISAKLYIKGVKINIAPIGEGIPSK